jgi:Ca2+/Na+ antiporter
MSWPAVIEHQETPRAAGLRRNRLRFALGIAALEGLAVIVGAIAWWVVVLLAAGTVALYLAFGRHHERGEVRQATWIAAVSQLLVVLVPVAIVVATFLAVGIVVLVAIGLLVALLTDRR